MGFKIPTWGDGIGALVGSIPKIIKHFKDRGRINEVKKINESVSTGDTKYINDILCRVTKRINDRKNAAS